MEVKDESLYQFQTGGMEAREIGPEPTGWPAARVGPCGPVLSWLLV